MTHDARGMTQNRYYKLPADLAADIDAYEQDVRRFLGGELPPGVLKAKRVPRGVYEQRQDGAFMVRVRVAGGTLTCDQTSTLAALSAEYGNSLLHVTTRQDVQLHDIAIEDTPAVMRRLMDAGLTSKGGGGNTVRNVTACPYAGICPHECFDVTPFAHAVTEYLIPLVGSYNLPRKYKIAFSGCAADCALAQVSDLGFIAQTRDGKPGFRVVAGGGMGAHSRVADELLPWTPVAEVVRIAETMRRLFDELGDRGNKHRARLRYVFERLGADTVRKRFGETMADVAKEGTPAWDGECAVNNDRTEADRGVPQPQSVDGIRYLPQRQEGWVAVPLHLPLGFVSADDFANIGKLARHFSKEDGPRTTRAQNMLIRFIREESLANLADGLRQLRTDVLAADPLERFVACAGASTCRLGLCLARGAARACATQLAQSAIAADTMEEMEVYINGCPNACGHQPIGQIGFFGAAQRVEGRLVPCYRVTLGGRCNADGARMGMAAGQIPARALPAFLADLAVDFQGARRDGEAFVPYFDRLGPDHFKALVTRHANVPSYEEEPGFYRDFGVDEDFSLAGRGVGECGAGVFEVIQEDLTAAEKADEPFDIVLPTARALLITRGVDARDADNVFREFETHFVDTGLVAEDFRALLARARGFTQGWRQAFEGHEATVARLLKRVKLLYGTLDANLEFHPPEGTPTAGRGSSHEDDGGGSSSPRGETSGNADGSPATPELDLRGVACPMNFVKAKLQLEHLEVGELLAVVLDDGDPAQNVPASFRNEGQTIEETTDLGDGHWRIVVRKER